MPDRDRNQRQHDDRPALAVEASAAANNQPIAGLRP
jgi:hypothetical protein